MQRKNAENRYKSHYSSCGSFLLLLVVLLIYFTFASVTFLWYWTYFLQGNKPITPSVIYPEMVEKEKEESAFDRFLDVGATFDLVYRQKVVSVWGVFSVSVRFLIVSLALYGSLRHRYGFYVPFMFYSIVVIIHFVMVLIANISSVSFSFFSLLLLHFAFQIMSYFVVARDYDILKEIRQVELEEKATYANQLSEISNKSSNEKIASNASSVTVSSVSAVPTAISQQPYLLRTNVSQRNTANETRIPMEKL